VDEQQPRRITYRAGRYLPGGSDVVWEDRALEGPLYHGGRGRVPVGGKLTAGRRTNSWGDQRGRSTHVYFAQDVATAAETAAACRRESGRGYLYEVTPDADEVELWHDGFRTDQPVTVVARLDLDAALHPPAPEPEAEAG
jgi:hypothetical protein